MLRRVVLSVPTEGYARRKGKVFLNHLEIAYGSLVEGYNSFYTSISTDVRLLPEENMCNAGMCLIS
jgi:hypothetical protein